MRSFHQAIAAAAVAHISSACAQDLSSTIVGCLDVNCPQEPNNTTENNCIISDKIFENIGLARIPVVASSNLTGFSWLEGASEDGGKEGDNLRTFHKSFYLGTPPDKDLNGTGACALFFEKVQNLRAFDGIPDYTVSQGTCQNALGDQCVNALTKRARELDLSGLRSAEACTKLQATFQENMDDACKVYATATKWEGISVLPLSGPDASGPITPDQNSTSNCWPILPKQYNLTPVTSTSTQGDYMENTTHAILFGVTPILTLFYPGNGSLLAQPESQLTCMKIIRNSIEGNKTIADGTHKGDDKKGAGSSFAPWGASLVAVLVLLSTLSI
ncbi:hypothetical protein B0O99DRAFT_302 [Bisporella sp. PMI_857]|nr:hypothetical protein B0O99DRAFT_302 [Bisporella sp. PMI_857]